MSRERRVRRRDKKRVLRGRESELARFVEILKTTISIGRGTAVSVVAEPGAGKTALLAETATAAQALGFRVVQLGLDEEFRPDLLIRLSGDSDLTAQDLRVVLENRLARAPLLIVLDDLRWSEPTAPTLELLFSLLTTRPLVCVLAHRPDSRAAHLDQLFRYAEDRDVMVHLSLRRLPDEAVASVVEDMLGAVPDDALTELVACAEGNAAALVGLLDGLVRDGAVRCENRIASLVPESTGTPENAVLPECLEALVQRRLDALWPQTRQTLDVAAVLGRTFAPADVAKMLRQPVAVLAPAFREALAADVLDCVAEKMRFRRDLDWQVVLRKVPVSLRSALHHQAAELLFSQGGSVVDLAEHLLLGATLRDPLTLEMLHQAAERTLASSPRAAAKLALRGLELMQGDSEEWLPLTMTAVEACTRAGPVSRAVELAGEASRREVPPEPARMLRYWLATALILQDRELDGAEVASGLLTDPGVPTDLSRRLLLNASIAATVRGVPIAVQATDVVDGQPFCPLGAWQAGMVTNALRMSDEAVLTDEARLPVTWIGHPLLARAAILTGLRDIEGARVAIADVEANVDPTLSGLPKLMSARIDLVVGRADNALAKATECLAIAKEVGVHLCLPAALIVLTTVASRRVDLAAKLAEDALVAWAVVEVGGRRPVALEWAQAQLALAQDDSHDRSHVLEWISSDPDSRRALFIGEHAAAAWTVRTALAVGKRDLAAMAADTAERLAKDNPEVRPLVMSAAHARGVLRGDGEDLAQVAEEDPDPWVRASAAEDLGVVLLGVNRDTAVTRLESAVALYESIAAERDAARVRRRLRMLGVVKRHWRSKAGPKTGVADLTQTERAVAALVTNGLTNKQIAARMFISHHTVAFHLRKVFRKLEIGSRIELAHLIQAGNV